MSSADGYREAGRPVCRRFIKLTYVRPFLCKYVTYL